MKDVIILIKFLFTGKINNCALPPSEIITVWNCTIVTWKNFLFKKLSSVEDLGLML